MSPPRLTEIVDRVRRVVLRLPARPTLEQHIPHGPGPLPGTPYQGPPIVAPDDAPHIPRGGREL